MWEEIALIKYKYSKLKNDLIENLKIDDPEKLEEILLLFGEKVDDTYFILKNEYFSQGNCLDNVSDVIDRYFGVEYSYQFFDYSYNYPYYNNSNATACRDYMKVEDAWKEINRDYIYLVWRDPIERIEHVVGKLYRNKTFRFEYMVNEIPESFKPLVAFPDIDKIYTSNNLFATFAARIPSKKRPEIKSILEQYKLEEFDEYELLKKTGGAQPIDTLYFIEPIININEPNIERYFYISEMKDYDLCDSIKCGDILNLEPELHVGYISDNVKIMLNGALIGFVPSYYSEEIKLCIENERKIHCEVIYINPNKRHWQEGIKVKLIIQ